MTPSCHGIASAVDAAGVVDAAAGNCSADLAWLEFGHALRVHFVLRPSVFAEGMDGVLGRLGLTHSAIDVVVCDERCGLEPAALARFTSELQHGGDAMHDMAARALARVIIELVDSGRAFGGRRGATPREEQTSTCCVGLWGLDAERFRTSSIP